MLRCGVVEDMDDKIARFYGGLRHEIQDIIDYKEYRSIQTLFHLAMLAEKELQGRQQSLRSRSTFMPRTPTPAPSRTAAPSTSRTSTTPSASRASATPPPAALRGQESGKSTVLQGAAAKPSSSNVSTD